MRARIRRTLRARIELCGAGLVRLPYPAEALADVLYGPLNFTTVRRMASPVPRYDDRVFDCEQVASRLACPPASDCIAGRNVNRRQSLDRA